MSSDFKPATFKAISLAGTGPRPITLGSTPAHPRDTILANGSIPRFLASSADIKQAIVAPAFNGEELPELKEEHTSEAKESMPNEQSEVKESVPVDQKEVIPDELKEKPNDEK